METNKRAKVRKHGYAKLLTVSGVPGYMRDLAEKGFRAELMEYVDWHQGITQKIKVLPYEESGIDQFKVIIEVRWVKQREPTCSVGALIKEFPEESDRKCFEELLLYYQDILMEPL